jgi:hypothetical protein
MLRPCCTVIISIIFLTACTKNDAPEANSLYGTWVNKNQPHDTLQFMRIDGKDMLQFNARLDTSVVRDTIAFSYKNGMLVLPGAGPNPPVRTIASFAWQENYKSFNILAYELYLFMSSSFTHFTYSKL